MGGTWPHPLGHQHTSSSLLAWCPQVRLHLSSRGVLKYEPLKVPYEDQELVGKLKLAYKSTSHLGSQCQKNGNQRAPRDTKKTSWGSWIRYFFKDFQPMQPGNAKRQAIDGLAYNGELYPPAFISFFLSFFIFSNFPIDTLSEFIFPLAVRIA